MLLRSALSWYCFIIAIAISSIGTLLQASSSLPTPPSASSAIIFHLQQWSELLHLFSQYFPSIAGNDTKAAVNANMFAPILISSFQSKMASLSTPLSLPPRGKDVGNRPRQEDAMEFLTFLLDTLHEEIVSYESSLSELPPPPPLSLDNNEQNEVEQRKKEVEDWNLVSKKPKAKVVVDESSKAAAEKETRASLISKLFHGILRSFSLFAVTSISS